MAICREFYFSSSDGSSRIHAAEWTPEGHEIIGVLQIAHGVAEYGMRYAPFAEFMTEHGFVVVANDHLGHGLSAEKDAETLYFGPYNGWKHVVDDMYALRCRTKEKYPDVPYFLMGHSMGSFLTRTYLICYPGTVDAAIIMGTGHQSPAVVAGGRAIAKAAGKRVVVVLNVVGPVDVSDYEADADAILCVFYPGMEGGRVAAQILFGEVNPSGKLPVTFPKRYKDAPTYGNFPGCAGEVFYGEGILVGYRYYDTKDVKPRYAFGHGLSYSKFEISDLTLDHTVVNYDNEETLTASVKVRNVSDRAGKEVVQIYISDVKSTLDKPVKELKAFRKVLLQPSEEQVLTFQITKDMLKSYDPEHKCWDCEAGYYEVLAGNASDNISCKAKFLVKCRSIYNYNEKTMLCVIHADERAAKIIDAQLEALHIDVSDMADALYYFPHREIGQVLHSMLDHAPIDEAVKKQAYEQIFEAVGALDISEL